MADCCNENHGADHVHDMTELDTDTDERMTTIDPGESRIPEHKDAFDARFTNFDPPHGVREAYIAYAKVDANEVEKDPALANCVLVGADFTAGRYEGDDFIEDPEGDEVRIARRYKSHFDRIRRITGYLVGTVDRFNDAKRHEEHDRVKHAMSSMAHEHTIGKV